VDLEETLSNFKTLSKDLLDMNIFLKSSDLSRIRSLSRISSINTSKNVKKWMEVVKTLEKI
jgi:hypothetical protein